MEQFLRLAQDPNYVNTIRMELPGFKKLGQSKTQESARAQVSDLVMGANFPGC